MSKLVNRNVTPLKTPVQLQKHDIIGQKLVQILQSYEVLDGWIHFAQNYFVLDSGIAFTFPFNVETEFTSTDVPDDAKKIFHPALNKALGSTIDGLYRPKNDDDFSEPDTILLHLDSGLWIWQFSSAPEGAHGIVGVSIEPDAPEYEMEMVDYWNADEA